MILILFYLVGAFAYYQIFCNVYIYRREYGSRDWHKDEKNKNAVWIWILGFIGLCLPYVGATFFFILYGIFAMVGIEEGYLMYKIPDNIIIKFLNKKV
jgi:hypothetical protein